MASKVPFSRLVLAKSGAFSSVEYPKTPESDEEVLWRAVIDRAIHDLGNENKKIRTEAEDWIDILNEDFIEVCRLARVMPKEVFEFIQKHASVLSANRYTYEVEEFIDLTIYLRIKRKIKDDSN